MNMWSDKLEGETKLNWWINPATNKFHSNYLRLDITSMSDIEVKRSKAYVRVLEDLKPLHPKFLKETEGESSLAIVTSWVLTWSQNNPYGLCFLTGEGLRDIVSRCLPSHPDYIDNPQELAIQLNAADNRLDLPKGPCEICGKGKGHKLPYGSR